MNKSKPGEVVFECDELKQHNDLINKVVESFTDKYMPSDDPQGCDLKTTWEIAEMYSGIVEMGREELAIKLNELGFKVKLIGSEFRWLLAPRF